MKSKLIDNVVKYYILITIICYFLFELSPIQSLLLGTPLYSFQKYLGIVGIILLLILLLKRKLIHSKYSIFLYVIIFSGVISSIITISYGFKHNLFDISWSVIYFTLFYSYIYLEGEKIKQHFKVIYKISSIIWAGSCLISILSFLFDTGYYAITNNYYETILTRQGFLENRLFGIFTTINSAAIISSILFIFGIFEYIKTKKIYIIIFNIIYFLFLILSGSRSSMLALIMVLFLFIFYYLLKNKKEYNLKIIFFSLMLSVLSIGLISGVTSILKIALSEFPKINLFYKNQYEYRNFLKNFDSIILSDDDNIDTKHKKILNREDVSSENYSNNRYGIWKDYISLSKEIGFFGLSPNNYSKYIKQNYNDKFIVTYVKENMPDKYNNGEIYQPHNTFIMIFVSTGVLGLVSLIIFISLVFRDITKYLYEIKFKSIDISILHYIFIMIFLFINMLFDSIIFFSNSIITSVFWIILALLVKQVNNKKEIL